MIKKAVSMPQPCPNCQRSIIRSQKRKWGCKWCIPAKSTEYCIEVCDKEWDTLLKWEKGKFK